MSTGLDAVNTSARAHCKATSTTNWKTPMCRPRLRSSRANARVASSALNVACPGTRSDATVQSPLRGTTAQQSPRPADPQSRKASNLCPCRTTSSNGFFDSSCEGGKSGGAANGGGSGGPACWISLLDSCTPSSGATVAGHGPSAIAIHDSATPTLGQQPSWRTLSAGALSNARPGSERGTEGSATAVMISRATASAEWPPRRAARNREPAACNTFLSSPGCTSASTPCRRRTRSL